MHHSDLIFDCAVARKLWEGRQRQKSPADAPGTVVRPESWLKVKLAAHCLRHLDVLCNLEVRRKDPETQCL